MPFGGCCCLREEGGTGAGECTDLRDEFPHLRGPGAARPVWNGSQQPQRILAKLYLPSAGVVGPLTSAQRHYVTLRDLGPYLGHCETKYGSHAPSGDLVSCGQHRLELRNARRTGAVRHGAKASRGSPAHQAGTIHSGLSREPRPEPGPWQPWGFGATVCRLPGMLHAATALR
jgi:hypothetical protein